MHYAGVEKVDPAKLEAQHQLTQALWTELVARGVRHGSTGRIESFFFADDENVAESLGAAYGIGDWEHEVMPIAPAGPRRVRVKIVSPEAVLTPKAFHELVDVMMVAAVEHACEFDGFQLDITAVKRRPWWRFW